MRTGEAILRIEIQRFLDAMINLGLTNDDITLILSAIIDSLKKQGVRDGK